ncbi:MAG: TetR/AcrR family transcriptional regulator, partial [Eggerthellaceae bacterium]|nr:TetR/AcrR family transcriptional regulator [Eggerthellaceae bacterium]
MQDETRVNAGEYSNQEAVMTAALEEFGRNDYKSASTEEIARKAGISKGSLFFHFKNKGQLFVKTADWLMDKALAAVLDEGYWQIDDFFDVLLYAGNLKKNTFTEKFPWAISFSVRAFYPEHRDIREVMNKWMQEHIDGMFEHYFQNVNFGKFRDDVDPRHVLNMLVWMADGWLHQQIAGD